MPVQPPQIGSIDVNTGMRLRVRKAAAAIRAGGIVAYPTEAVYGLGCDPSDPDAVLRLCTLKQRPVSAGLILIAAAPEQLDGWIWPGPLEWARLVRKTEHAVTWVVTAARDCPHWITGGRSSVAVRITRHPVASALCTQTGMPLVSTSANRRSRPPARSALGARRLFGTDIEAVVAGPTGMARRPSEIRNAQTGRILRPGGS